MTTTPNDINELIACCARTLIIANEQSRISNDDRIIELLMSIDIDAHGVLIGDDEFDMIIMLLEVDHRYAIKQYRSSDAHALLIDRVRAIINDRFDMGV